MEGKLNLYQKISAITESLGVIQKDSAAPAAMGGYRFISHAQILGHLRHELTKRNVVIVPSGVELVKSEVYSYKNSKGEDKQTIHTIIKFIFEVVDGDNPSDSFSAHWYGEGHDSSDKGIQKAGTSAEKYFLMKLFKVSDKDDPDAISNDDSSTKSASASMGVRAEIKEKASDPLVLSNIPPADEKPTEVPVSQIPNNGSDPDLKSKQLKALIWFGEQLPPSEGWFAGKINAMVQLWENKNKTGKLTDQEREAGSSVKHVFGMIAETHHKVCGEDCRHISAAELAVVLGGTISDPVK